MSHIMTRSSLGYRASQSGQPQKKTFFKRGFLNIFFCLVICTASNVGPFLKHFDSWGWCKSLKVTQGHPRSQNVIEGHFVSFLSSFEANGKV